MPSRKNMLTKKIAPRTKYPHEKKIATRKVLSRNNNHKTKLAQQTPHDKIGPPKFLKKLTSRKHTHAKESHIKSTLMKKCPHEKLAARQNRPTKKLPSSK